jgi:hypothetical protein
MLQNTAIAKLSLRPQRANRPFQATDLSRTVTRREDIGGATKKRSDKTFPGYHPIQNNKAEDKLEDLRHYNYTAKLLLMTNKAKSPPKLSIYAEQSQGGGRLKDLGYYRTLEDSETYPPNYKEAEGINSRQGLSDGRSAWGSCFFKSFTRAQKGRQTKLRDI